MNIIFLYRAYPNYGGVEVVTTVLANKFVSDGHGVTIVSFEQPHMELAGQLYAGIDIERLNYPIVSRANVKKLHGIIVRKRVDIVVNQWGLPFHTTMLCNKAMRGTACRLISVLHGSPNTSKVIIKAQDAVKCAANPVSRVVCGALLRAKESVVKASIRYACKHSERYVLLSEGFIRPLADYARLKSTVNVVAIGNPVTIPVDLDGFDFAKKKRQLLYVGRMDYENKRVNRIVEAWQELYGQYPDWELVLVGDGPHKSKLMDYVHDNDIARVRFEGFQVDPPIKYYRDASIFMLTSDLEGFGLVIIESMSYGVVPVVYGSYEAVFDIIRDGFSGFITPYPYNKEYTVKKIKYLMDNPSHRIEMAKEAMIDAGKFTVDSIARQWYEMFEEVIG